MTKKKNLMIVQASLIASIYFILVFLLRPISFGPIQVRVAEALTLLPYFTPAAVPGLFIGCLLANIAGGADIMDIIFGSLTTLAAAYTSYKLRKNLWLMVIPPILYNAIVIGILLKFVYGLDQVLWFLMLTVGLGQFVSVALLGLSLVRFLEPYKEKLFKYQ